MIVNVQQGENVKIFQPHLVNLYGCKIGTDTKIGAFVEIQEGVVIGERCKISSHSFICTGITIQNEVFIGHGVMFTNDRHPRATDEEGQLKTSYNLETTLVAEGASIGSGAIILPGIEIGRKAMVAAGSVVTRSVPDNCLWILGRIQPYL